MEFNFSLKRVLVLIALVAVFALLGGFSPPEVSPGGVLSSRKVTKAWFYCVLLFLSGSVSSTIVDHFVGLMDRSNIRLIYVIVGIVVMIASVVWLRSLKAGVPAPTEASFGVLKQAITQACGCGHALPHQARNSISTSRS